MPKNKVKTDSKEVGRAAYYGWDLTAERENRKKRILAFVDEQSD